MTVEDELTPRFFMRHEGRAYFMDKHGNIYIKKSGAFWFCARVKEGRLSAYKLIKRGGATPQLEVRFE